MNEDPFSDHGSDSTTGTSSGNFYWITISTTNDSSSTTIYGSSTPTSRPTRQYEDPFES